MANDPYFQYLRRRESKVKSVQHLGTSHDPDVLLLDGPVRMQAYYNTENNPSKDYCATVWSAALAKAKDLGMLGDAAKSSSLHFVRTKCPRATSFMLHYTSVKFERFYECLQSICANSGAITVFGKATGSMPPSFACDTEEDLVKPIFLLKRQW
ncbi:hypothetical protein FOZ61_003544 [Perkinsus olseni]|uniref:Uncharacterized protein n=1 Tax=Perkinsus olseni TaxID=32597 RepID=A0A7J6MDW8_PEROL|nr:hypothetical protein FOZ61_003544 [Perkinsus olseni]KAF4674510.1 hypothetical protein FOL46_004766 [Perkinsus olseni]